jgi:hypothetical protein
MMAGVLQGVAFTPVENTVKILRKGTMTWFDGMRSLVGLQPIHHHHPHPIAQHHTRSPSTIIPAITQNVRSFLGLGAGLGPAWHGLRWSIARDGVAYAVFFAAFDASRRAGLEVKRLMSSPSVLTSELKRVNRDDDGDTIIIRSSVNASPSTSAPTSARLTQASVLVLGGISASLMAELASRPFRNLESFSRRHRHRAQGLEFHSTPNDVQGRVKPFARSGGGDSVMTMTKDLVRSEGWNGLWRNPAIVPGTRVVDLKLSRGKRVVEGARRFAWRLAGVAPWGLGFLVFAYVGGEV